MVLLIKAAFCLLNKI